MRVENTEVKALVEMTVDIVMEVVVVVYEEMVDMERMHIWDYCLKWIILSQFLQDVLVEDKEVMVVVEETVDTETEIVVAMEKEVVDTEYSLMFSI
ncbi:hypothetical protein Bca52824_034115 [Brassica carinata]|uniref:Uncharacterized protein n=1 Tax=Brassica carinata TaxID=52824 RepID=A0A8X7SE38_BRACI|nr:hypothetical protein Bca52824_034115 [Brassica carinata]